MHKFLKALREALDGLFNRYLDNANLPSTLRVVWHESDYGSPIGWVVESLDSTGKLLHQSAAFKDLADAQVYCNMLAQSYGVYEQRYVMSVSGLAP